MELTNPQDPLAEAVIKYTFVVVVTYFKDNQSDSLLFPLKVQWRLLV